MFVIDSTRFSSRQPAGAERGGHVVNFSPPPEPNVWCSLVAAGTVGEGAGRYKDLGGVVLLGPRPAIAVSDDQPVVAELAENRGGVQTSDAGGPGSAVDGQCGVVGSA